MAQACPSGSSTPNRPPSAVYEPLSREGAVTPCDDHARTLPAVPRPQNDVGPRCKHGTTDASRNIELISAPEGWVFVAGASARPSKDSEKRRYLPPKNNSAPGASAGAGAAVTCRPKPVK